MYICFLVGWFFCEEETNQEEGHLRMQSKISKVKNWREVVFEHPQLRNKLKPIGQRFFR